jgi:peptidoglycan/LPS O-acetylase OafA/YrhL
LGTLRTIYALSVLFGHSWPGLPMFVGGRNAVQLFYMISGFLISYVLVENKTYPGVSSFYINRYLRLYPIYAAVALVALAFLLATRDQGFFDVLRSAPAAAIVLLAFSNLFLFGQDWVMFAGVRHHNLVLATSFGQTDVELYPGLLIAQAWTLGVELSFYLLAPFILARRKVIYGLLALAVAVRIGLILSGLGLHDPWTYRFFPAELAFFLLGALAHQVLLPAYRRIVAMRGSILPEIATGVLVAASLAFAALPGAGLIKTASLFLLFILLVPMAFLFQNRHRWDGRIGNLSYPIYIVHMLVFRMLDFAMDRIGHADRRIIAVVGALISIALALLLNRFIGEPLERVRRTLKARGSGGRPRPPTL